MNFTQDERAAYEGRLKWLMIQANTLKKAKEESLQEGLLQGRQEGLLQGKQEGLAEASIQIAKKMLTRGQDVQYIADITGLSVAEIEQSTHRKVQRIHKKMINKIRA